MSEETTETTNCPECGYPNAADAPFCERCGYRMRRQADTAVEGHRAVRPLTDQAATVREAPVDPRRFAQAATVRETPAVRPSDLASNSPTAVEGNRAVRPRNEPLDPSTVEGLTPVSPDSITAPVDYEVGHAESDASASMPAAREAEARSRAPLWALLWISSVVAVGMSVWFYAKPTPETAGAAEEQQVTSVRGPIAVPAGPFRQGLDESVRSFILTACLNQADDKSRCDQNELLGGEFPEKTVELPAYSIDATEVTLAEWRECVAAKKCTPPDYKECKVYSNQGIQVGMRVPKHVRDPAHPVSCVTRAEASTYCKFRGGRLPTDAEWERAARGDDGRIFPWGSTWDPTVANWGEFDVGRVSVVGKIDGHEWSSPPGVFPEGKSPGGLYDMAGNVAEWVQGGDQLRGFARGGSWASTPFDLRTTGRLDLDVDARRADVGLRCAYPPPN